MAEMIKPICLFFSIICTYGCAHVQKVPEVVHVDVPVPVPCVVEVEKPQFKTDAEFDQMDDYTFVIQLWLDRLIRINYERELESAAEACR